MLTPGPYPAVIIPVLTQHYPMLQRNLLYTGVTRGKRLVVLVGQKKAVAIAVRNISGRKRWSKLQEWLRPAPHLAPHLVRFPWLAAVQANGSEDSADHALTDVARGFEESDGADRAYCRPTGSSTVTCGVRPTSSPSRTDHTHSMLGLCDFAEGLTELPAPLSMSFTSCVNAPGRSRFGS
jgi:UvrD-like helicase C-terminal domain